MGLSTNQLRMFFFAGYLRIPEKKHPESFLKLPQIPLIHLFLAKSCKLNPSDQVARVAPQRRKVRQFLTSCWVVWPQLFWALRMQKQLAGGVFAGLFREAGNRGEIEGVKVWREREREKEHDLFSLVLKNRSHGPSRKTRISRNLFNITNGLLSFIS